MLRGPRGWSLPPTDLSTGLVAADMFQVSVPPLGFAWGLGFHPAPRGVLLSPLPGGALILTLGVLVYSSLR